MNEAAKASLVTSEEILWGERPRPCRVAPKGRVVVCTPEEFQQWKDETPDRWLLRTNVPNGVVETTFEGRHGPQKCFWAYFVSNGRRDMLQLGRREGHAIAYAENLHEDAVGEALRYWFSVPSFPDAPSTSYVPAGVALRGDTLRSALCGPEHLSRIQEPCGAEPPRRMWSLRYRLLKRLLLRPANWYELQDALATDEAHGLAAMERAWHGGLLRRLEGTTKADPPTFALSPPALTLCEQGRLTEYEQGLATWAADVWVPGWQPWRRYFCRLCGAPGNKCKTMTGNIRIYCSRRTGGRSAECPGQWFIVLRDGRPAIEKFECGEIVIGLDHMRKTSVVLVGHETMKSTKRVFTYDEVREKLRTYTLFS